MKKIILLITLMLFSLSSIVNADSTDVKTNQKYKLILIGESKAGYKQYLKVIPSLKEIKQIVFYNDESNNAVDVGYHYSLTSLDITFDDGSKLKIGYLGDDFDSEINKKISKIVLDGAETNTGILIEKGTIKEAFNSIPDEKTYLELNTEYNQENSKKTDIDYKKLDSITEEITNKVKSEENSKNYNKYTKVFKLVLSKAKKDNQNFGEFYNYWVKFRYQIDDYLSAGKVQSESKLETLYTIQTIINDTVNGLCDKIGGCGIGQDNSKLLKDIQ